MLINRKLKVQKDIAELIDILKIFPFNETKEICKSYKLEELEEMRINLLNSNMYLAKAANVILRKEKGIDISELFKN